MDLECRDQGHDRYRCAGCGVCTVCDDCTCSALFDADELGLDPETDNTPGDESRHA